MSTSSAVHISGCFQSLARASFSKYFWCRCCKRPLCFCKSANALVQPLVLLALLAGTAGSPGSWAVVCLCVCVSAQAWPFQRPVELQVLLNQTHELQRHVILAVYLGAPNSPIWQSHLFTTPLQATSHRGAMEGHVEDGVVQNVKQDVQAAEQMKAVVCITALYTFVSLHLKESKERLIQMSCPLSCSWLEPIMQIGLIVPIALLLIVLHLAGEDFVGALKLALDFSSVGWPSSSRGL